MKIKQPKLTSVGNQVMAKRYLMTDMAGKPTENPGEMLMRVAKHIAKAEIQWPSSDDKGNMLNGEAPKYWADKFYDCMVNWKFVCAGKAMFEAGNPGGTGQLSSCFVLPIEDNIQSIFKTLGDAAVIHKNNGGTGFNFSKIRPHGDKVKNVPQAASGPVDFIRAYSAALSQILQGAKRQGANIAILNASHPDIEEFIHLKEQDGTIKNFNISVGVTNEFMAAVQTKKNWNLINPRNGQTVKTLKARDLFNQIAATAWATGDPGLAFLDKMEEENPTPSIGNIDATNPCITGDSLIPTETGLIRFDELVTGYHSEEKIKICIDKRLNQKIQIAEIANVQSTGTKDVFEIKTEHGFKLKATKDHQIMTSTGWKEVRHLDSSDKVYIQSNPGLFSTEHLLSKIVTLTQRYPVSFPKNADKLLGEVLGYFVGDGSVRNDKKDKYTYLTFGTKRQNLVKYFQHIFREWGIHITVRQPNARSLQLWSRKQEVSNFLIDCGLLPVYSDKKRVPQSIYKMPKVAIAGFLRGLFSADGTIGFIKNKSAYIRLSSKSELLLQDVQLLLLNHGIFSKIYNRSRHPRENIFPEYINKNGTKVKYGSDGILFELEVSKNQTLKFIDKIGFIEDLHQEKITLLKSKTYYQQQFVDKVLSVTPIGQEKVYDLSEPLTHSFIANGFVVHNCGEIPLLPYESCNLTSIVLTNHLKKNIKGEWEIDWKDLKNSIHLGIRFLDDMIEVNNYALDSIRQMVKEGNRRIGLGVMGFAHLLYRLRIPYDSAEAVRLAERIAKFMRQEAEIASKQLAKERGSFPNFDVSIYAGSTETYRNAALLMIAPTGTTSLIADSSSGIEPVFSLVTVRRSFNEDSKNNAPTQEFTLADPEFSQYVESKLGAPKAKKIFDRLANGEDVNTIEHLSSEDKRVFTTTHHIKPEWHIKIQAAWQKWIDNSVSKTINFPSQATIDDVKKAYELGWRLGLKGITIYRDGSKLDQVLNVKGKEAATSSTTHLHPPSKPGSAQKTVCPECGAAAQFKDGCISCPQCGWSKCSM